MKLATPCGWTLDKHVEKVFSCQWDYMINCNENENDNEKIY